VLVRVEGVSKKFCRSLKKSLWYGVCDIAGELNPFARHGAGGMEHGVRGSASGGSNPLVTRLPEGHLAEPRFTSLVTPEARDEDLRDGEFYAVRDVSFELRRGECLGLIGHNGAGKTTLLKMLNGLIKPDSGKITMRGRVGALIALGAGFNPILTGRENIYINGSVLGLSKKEIDDKIDEIIEFAEIGEFIDSPVMNYSSGMNVRLGFSVAANLINPDILILDEVLAVGDDHFRLKCLDRIGQMLASGVAGILVTHQMMNVERTCTRCNVMAHGRVVLATSDIPRAIQMYLGLGGGAAGDLEIIAGPDALFEIVTADYDPEAGAVRVVCRNERDTSLRVFMTYRVFLGANELFQGSTRYSNHPELPAGLSSVAVDFPQELRRLGDLRVYVSIYDAASNKPLVLIKDVKVPAEIGASYRLDMSVHAPAGEHGLRLLGTGR
jgi:ABC-type polysaccharide/polyol phosphate transport system ATPase subunit